ncbi:MAG: DUF1294 domain-containing protein [Eggerthellaceae bacterium]
MDPFVVYLIAANVVAFIAYTVDFFLCRAFPKLDDTRANSIAMCLFPIAGGPVGALLALFLWAGTLGRSRMNKKNVAWWFLSIVCLIAWSIVVAVDLGLVDLGESGIAGDWTLSALKVLGAYLAVVNVATFALFAVDKAIAARGSRRSRIPEACLLGMGLIGGAIGGIVAMYAVRHKTKKWYFVIGLPVFLVLDAFLVVFAHSVGLI